jgi:hypothetical protein
VFERPDDLYDLYIWLWSLMLACLYTYVPLCAGQCPQRLHAWCMVLMVAKDNWHNLLNLASIVYVSWFLSHVQYT